MRTASILIRTKNEERSLDETLRRVFGQSVRPHEVFIIDSGSRDRTLQIAGRYPVKTIRLPQKGWSYPGALNAGARNATGEFLVCLSAHCLPLSEDWLANLLRHFDDPLVAAVWGPSYPVLTVAHASAPIRQEPGSYTYENRTWGLSNSNSALRRRLWLEFPFDESLPATEDKAWGREAMARGFCLVYDPAAAVHHGKHTVVNSYRRSRAIHAGYRALFPELATSGGGEYNLGRRFWRKLVRHAHQRSLADFTHDVRRFPSLLAGVLGKSVSRRSR